MVRSDGPTLNAFFESLADWETQLQQEKQLVEGLLR